MRFLQKPCLFTASGEIIKGHEKKKINKIFIDKTPLTYQISKAQEN